MGCASSIEENNKKVSKKPIMPYYEPLSNTNPNFEDMPETNNGRKVGLVVKKIPNYICSLPYDKLDELRKQFWLTKDLSDNVWRVLKICCEIDGESAHNLLKKNNLECLQDNIRLTYSKYQPNFIYKLPNFCITDPYFERNYDGYEKIYDMQEDNIINIKLWYYNNNNTYDVKISNKSTGFDLKVQLSKMNKLALSENRFRIFFAGQEIEETHCMYYHNLEEGNIIQMISNPKGITK